MALAFLFGQVTAEGDLAMAAETDLVFTVDEAARELKLHRDTVYRRCRDATLPSIRVGRRWLIPAYALREWLQAQVALNNAGREGAAE